MFEVEGGVLYLKAGAVLDHENATSHSVTVRLDGSDLSQEFTLTVENRLDEVPVFAEVAEVIGVEEGTVATRYVARLTKVDDAASAILFQLATDGDAGADAGLFVIDARTGALSFKQAPEFETRRDADGNNRYEVTVLVTTRDDAGNTLTARQDVTVAVQREVQTGRDGTPDTFEVDGNAGPRHVATMIVGFRDGEDEIETDAKEMFAQVEQDPFDGSYYTVLYSSGDTKDGNNVLAVLRDFAPSNMAISQTSPPRISAQPWPRIRSPSFRRSIRPLKGHRQVVRVGQDLFTVPGRPTSLLSDHRI